MSELGELKVYEVYKARFPDVYVLVPGDWGGNGYCEAIFVLSTEMAVFVLSTEMADWWTGPVGKDGEFWSEAEHIGLVDSVKEFLARLV